MRAIPATITPTTPASQATRLFLERGFIRTSLPVPGEFGKREAARLRRRPKAEVHETNSPPMPFTYGSIQWIAEQQTMRKKLAPDFADNLGDHPETDLRHDERGHGNEHG